jgi:CheY-like chemotaxis protein
VPNQPASKKSILLVDDDRAFLEMLAELMDTQQAGAWEIHLATSTAQALSMLRERSVDLVVLDLEMPVVDGIQFLRLLERKYPGLRKAVLTGHGDPARRTECMEHGAELFLEKPQTADGYESVLAALFELATIGEDPRSRGAQNQVASPGAPVLLDGVAQSGPVPSAVDAKPASVASGPDVVVEEIVLCAGAERAVLYEWQCRNVEARLKLFQQLAAAAERISKLGGFGKFIRCEALAPPERLIVQIKSDRHLLVRCRRGAPASMKGR